jgi:type I restriction-modification system DNA methylase subunit
MHTLNKAFEKIHFTHQNGLVFCENPEKAEHISEKYHIQEKCIKLGVTAVLFRRSYNENFEIVNSKPVLYIFYNENEDLGINSEKHKKLHAEIWSAGEIDVYFIVSKTRIDIFNARKPAQIVEDTRDLVLDDLRLVSNTLQDFNDQRFSAIVFGKGTFWEQEDFLDPDGDKNFYRNQLNEENLPFHQLLEHLKDVRQYLHRHQKDLLGKTIDKLLIICILVKFLEEIKDDNGKHTLREIYKAHEVRDFAEALEKGNCIAILDDLAKEFNGQIFDRFDEREKKKLKQTNLQPVADFLKGDLDIRTGQYFIWKQYSFNYLPVELISSIYENFLPREKGVVYTPPFLVNFLIDEVMPLDRASTYFSNEQFSVFDPSCGSGVFLVSAYKRMLQWWSVNHYQKTGEIKFPPKGVCQKILKDNIFGVDINSTATLISIFSLTIALLDKLEPKEIWNNLKLDSLRDNIQTQNFFKWANTDGHGNKKFDLILGNPPFNPVSGSSKKNAVSERQIQLFGVKNKDIPNNNFALKFFEGAMFFGKRTCLIVPSHVLLYDKTNSAQKYRNRLFTKFTIAKIFDFTHLRRSLFGSADTPVCAILSNTNGSNGQNIEHIVIKRIASIEKKILFEIDHHDRHFVRHDWAIDEAKQFVWKANLLGDGRLFHLIYRLSLLPTLKDFISSKEKENDEWIYSSGYKVGGKTKKKSADFISRGDKIEAITEEGDYIISLDGEENKQLEFFPDERLYKPPFLVFDQILGENNIPISFIQHYEKKELLYFNRDFVGIHAPQENRSDLAKIYKSIRFQFNNLYRFYALLMSGSCMVLTETEINKRDIDALPFPENIEYLNLTTAERILLEDVLEYYVHLGKAISEKGQGRKLHEKVSQEQLKKFGETFCEALNPIYSKNDKSWQCGKFSQTQSFTICQLGYGKNNGLSYERFDAEELDNTIKSLIYNNTSNRGAIFTRVFRDYKHLNGYDCVFLIKPNAVRYWLGSIALQDADETFMDLKEGGR